LITEMTAVVAAMNDHGELEAFRDELSKAIQGLADSSAWLGERLASGDIQSALAGASPYLRQFGTVLGGWLMGRAALAALAAPPEVEAELLAEKLLTARFYGEQLLPIANAMTSAVRGGANILENAVF
jgi:hypothetical protein